MVVRVAVVVGLGMVVVDRVGVVAVVGTSSVDVLGAVVAVGMGLGGKVGVFDFWQMKVIGPSEK